MVNQGNHVHRWSTIKRWKIGDKYFVIQRCRKCEQWIRRQVCLDALSTQPTMSTIQIVDKSVGIEASEKQGDSLTTQSNNESANSHSDQRIFEGDHQKDGQTS